MKSGETAEYGNGRLDVQTARKRSAQGRSWKPGRRRQPSAARERWKPVRGETRVARLDAEHESAAGRFMAGDGENALILRREQQGRPNECNNLAATPFCRWHRDDAPPRLLAAAPPMATHVAKTANDTQAQMGHNVATTKFEACDGQQQ
ncbi:hypothetical protein VNPA141486_12000 [Pseudomonas aeruginosa]|nr:hypothetical protein VNPA141486_12000 [Pseudomonas aeruginosa]GLF50715.1 hypothetical protein VNPA141818_12170 [Pseudomonas aeruginosa]